MVWPRRHAENLVAVEESLLLVVDCGEAGVDPVPEAVPGDTCGDRSRLDVLIEEAERLGVPILSVSFDANAQLSEEEAQLRNEGAPLHLKRAKMNPWDEPVIVEAIRLRNRARLIVAGRCAEIAVSFAVLGALTEGYDPFIVSDAALSADARTAEAAVRRMTQAGAVETSVRQILAEWRRSVEIYS